MARSRVPGALIAALAVGAVGCGGDGNDASERKRFTPSIADIHNVTPDYTREIVEVTGSATPVKELGFVLRGGDASIFVGATPGEMGDLAPGDRVTVVGAVRPLTRFLERRVESPRDLSRPPGDEGGRASKAARRAVRQTPTDTGDPYIEADAVEPAAG